MKSGLFWFGGFAMLSSLAIAGPITFPTEVITASFLPEAATFGLLGGALLALGLLGKKFARR